MAGPAEASDWQSKRPFEETNWHMLQNDVLCDVIFLVGTSKKEEIKAHKFLLASRSPVFFSMFCGSLAEGSSNIEIPDIESWAFRELLRFIYTEDCGINEKSVMALLYCSKKYESKRLTEKCMEYLNDQISEENVCVILQHAHSFDEKELEQKCLQCVLEQGDEVLKTDGLLSVSKEVLEKIIESDNLKADEVNIYNACKKWAVQQSKQECDKQESLPSEVRQKLGDLLYLIRFSTLSFESFAKYVSKDRILTPEECVNVFECIADGNTKPVKFVGRKRVRKHIELKRFKSTGIGWGYGGKPDAINFLVSSTAKLLGVCLFAPCTMGTTKGEVSLRHGESILESKCDVEMVYEETKKSEDVMFDQPQILKSGKQYSIHVLLKGVKTYHGKEGMQKHECDDLSVTFIESDKDANGTSVESGQILGLILEV